MPVFSARLFNTTKQKTDAAIFLCALLACLVPRYIATFKLHIGLNISLFTIATLITWLVYCRRIYFKPRIDSLFLMLWFMFIVLSVWQVKMIGVWAYYVIWSLTAILFQQVLIERADRHTYFVIIKAFCFAMMVHILIGLYEITHHTYLFDNPIPRIDIATRLYGNVAIGIFHNLNDYAVFLATMLPFPLLMFLKSKNILSKVYFASLCCTAVYLINLSESRGALLAVSLIIFVIIVQFASRNAVTSLLACVLFAIVCIFVYINPSLNSSVKEFLNVNSISFDAAEGSDYVRVNLIRNGWYFLSETHGLGVGSGNMYWWLSNRAIYDVADIKFMHNWYFEVLFTFGVVFFIIYMYFHIHTIVKLVHYSKVERDDFSISKCFLVCFLAFSIASVSSSSNVYSEWVWMYLALYASYTQYLDTKTIAIIESSDLDE